MRHDAVASGKAALAWACGMGIAVKRMSLNNMKGKGMNRIKMQ